MEMHLQHSLPSPFDPIHHVGRRLDPLAVQTESQAGSSDSIHRETLPLQPSVPTASALWPNTINNANSSNSNSGVPSVPASPAAAKRVGSMSFGGMENGMEPLQEFKGNGIPSPSAAPRSILDGNTQASGDGSGNSTRIINRHHSNSWAGSMPPLPNIVNPTITGTPSSRTHSYANIPQIPASGINATGLQRDGSGSATVPSSASSSAAPAAWTVPSASVTNTAALPSVEDVARSVIQQLVLGSPRSQALGGLLGLVSQAAPTTAAQHPPQAVASASTPRAATPAAAVSTSATMPSTASSQSMNSLASSAANFEYPTDSSTASGAVTGTTTSTGTYTHLPSPLQSNTNVHVNAHAPMPSALIPSATQVVNAPAASGVVSADGTVLPVAAEMPQNGVPSTTGSLGSDSTNPSSATSSLEKRAEHILDQHLLSSQKVPSYRTPDDFGLPSDSGGSQSANFFLTRLFGLHGQVAIVTGAARGIGLALARGLAMAGARVCMADMNFDQVARESAALNDELKQSDATFPLGVDVTKRESIVNLFTTTVERYGLLSICVNNAGLAISGEDPKRNYSESFSEDDFDHTINLNLKAVFFCCQFAARWMIANSVQGSIINIASMSAKVVNWPQRQSVYNASKAAVVQLTKCLAVEWCSYGIRVNSISPGYIDTPLNRQISIAHLRHEWQKKTPQHRLGDPRDLVAAVIYLASNRAAAFTTGENIIIDGGYTLW